jgi:hypothetical protein
MRIPACQVKHDVFAGPPRWWKGGPGGYIAAPMRNLVAALLTAALLAAVPHTAPAAGQTARAPVVLELPVSVRAAALGHAFVLGSIDANSLFHNAAFGESLRGVSGTAHAHGARSTVHAVAGGMEWWGAAVGIGLQSVSYVPDASGDAGVAGRLLGRGPDPVHEQVAALSYARRVRGLRAGLVGKWVEQRTGVQRAGGVAADIAIGTTLGPIMIGLTAQNLGPSLSIAGRDAPLPDRVTLGASARPLPVGPLDVTATAAAGRDTRGNLFAGGGAEVSWWPIVGRTFSARLGGTTTAADPGARPLTVGAGFAGDRIALDYAFQSFGERGDVHRIGVRWR